MAKIEHNIPTITEFLAAHMPDRSGDYWAGNVGCTCGAVR